MKAANATCIALLATGRFLVADLYTFTLVDGTVLRYTSFDIDINYNSLTWSAFGPVLSRSRTRTIIGVEVDTLSITIAPKDTDLIGSSTWLQAVCSGRLDGAEIVLDQAYLSLELSVADTINKFVGKAAQLTINRHKIEMEVNSPLEGLNISMPRNVYQDGCQHTLFDSGCGLVAASFAVSGSVGSSPTTRTFNTALAQDANYFSLGVLQFTSGALTGTKRTVALQQAGGAITLLSPLPVAPQTGDTFTIYPGCDKTKATCESVKFNNVVNFKGFPFIPVPETAL